MDISHRHSQHGQTRRCGPGLAALLALLAALAGGCGKSPEEVKAAKAEETARTTGMLLVRSNVADAEFEALRLNDTSGPALAGPKGPVNQPLARLAPGRYTAIVRAPGWADLSGMVEVQPGQTTEVDMNFKTGALHLDSVPAGATVKLGGQPLGQTPVFLPQLPAGECELTLEYQSWPPLKFRTTVPDGAEATATARLPHGRLTIESVPLGATVTFQSQVLGTTPLTVAEFPAGQAKLHLKSEGFPAAVVGFTLEDGANLTIRPELGAVFPLLNPPEILRDVWAAKDSGRLAPSFDSVGKYEPRNSIVKNLQRRKLYENWMTKRYRFSGVVTGVDPAQGRIEFAEQNSELSRYRVVALFTTAAFAELKATGPVAKGANLAVHGQLAAVEEPRWPAKTILFELSAAGVIRVDGPAAP